MKAEEITKLLLQELETIKQTQNDELQTNINASNNDVKFDEYGQNLVDFKANNANLDCDFVSKIDKTNLDEKMIENSAQNQVQNDIKIHFEQLYTQKINDEKAFLNSVKERILVLFEGLNNFDKNDIEARVELSLKFIEFLLANIEKRLENLSK
jgi:hypothetical protein